MRLRISFKTLTLLCKSDTSVSVWWRYLVGRLAKLVSRMFRNTGLENEIRAARGVFKDHTRDLKFSHTWFDGSIPLWVRILARLKSSGRPVDVLEIGSWEGRSTVFLLGYFANGKVTAVDTWEGGDEHDEFDELSSLEQRFDANVARHAERVIKKKGQSSLTLAQMAVAQRECFDLVFIDGSHYADDVMIDAVLAWRLLRKDGIMIFDDYLWRIDRYGWKKNPAKAVNLFLRLIEDEHELIHVGHQLALRKSASMTDYTSH